MRYANPPTNSALYQRYHKVVRLRYGPASDYYCVRECGRIARDWAWVHDTDPSDPENYMTLCRLCHQEYDRPEWLTEERKRERARIENTPQHKGWTPERRKALSDLNRERAKDPEYIKRRSEACSQGRPWESRRVKNGAGVRLS